MNEKQIRLFMWELIRVVKVKWIYVEVNVDWYIIIGVCI